METSGELLVDGGDVSRPLDALFVNAPLRDYDSRPRVNDFTLPVLGLAYIATFAAAQGFNVAVLDVEARGLGLTAATELINRLSPRWVGLNLLAPTYELSARLASGLDPSIAIMAGGHQAKAMPTEILADPRFRQLCALVLGEGEYRVARLLADREQRLQLPQVMWRNWSSGEVWSGRAADPGQQLAPDIDALPHLDRRFLADDPHVCSDGTIEANMVATRGCPYDCAFCGAAVSANPDVQIRARDPFGVIGEMEALHSRYGVTAFRFVDDLFLGHQRLIRRYMDVFTAADVGRRFVWDATGRINILDRADDSLLAQLQANGCREIALGIESGSPRILEYMGKRITPEMTARVVQRLTAHGIGVKGYFILGYPTETRAELDQTVAHVRQLWELTQQTPGRFRVSVFEFRPYPGTPEWHRLLESGKYQPEQLLAYTALDLTAEGGGEAMRERDEFNFSVNLQFGEADLAYVRDCLVSLVREQYDRRQAA
jgi:radical SAM superfamily enzyme YgiQ (UPF0313 family)